MTNIYLKVTKLDKTVTADLLDKIQKTNTSNITPKEIRLELDSTKGNIQMASEILEAIHTSSVDLIISCKGKLSVAGTILAAGGKPKFRSAKIGTRFALGKGKSKNKLVQNTNQELVQNTNQEEIKSILNGLSKKKKLINEFLETKNTLTAYEAIECGIIDSTDFRSKYINTNKRIKKDQKVEVK